VPESVSTECQNARGLNVKSVMCSTYTDLF